MDHVHNEPEPRVFSSAMGGQQVERRRVERKMRIHRQPKTLITGVGAVDQLGVEAKKLNGTKVLVITDEGVSAVRHVRRRRAAAASRPASRWRSTTRPSPNRR